MPAVIYRDKAGARVPSVTTINKIGQDSGGLIHWAWQLGIDGLDYRTVRDDAAKAGEIGHILVDAAIKNRLLIDEDFPTSGARDMGMKAFEAYERWEAGTKIRWTDSELSLVSEKYRYGGTIDAVGIPEGANTYCIGDWKTGALYPDHLCQIAAYAHLFEECTGHSVKGAHLCRFNKLTGDFMHAYFEDLSDAWDAFLLKRQLYSKLAELKKRI